MPTSKPRGFRYGSQSRSDEPRKAPRIEIGDAESAPAPNPEGTTIKLDPTVKRGGGRGPSPDTETNRPKQWAPKPYTGR